MTPEEEFNALPAYVRELALMFVEGGFGERGGQWLKMFNDYVDFVREARKE